MTNLINHPDKKHGKMGKLKAVRGKKHTHLGMNLDHSEKGKVKIDVKNHILDIIATHPANCKATDTSPTPANNNSFKQDESPKPSQRAKELFHTLVAKCPFISKRSRPDIQPTVVTLCSRVKEPNLTDAAKLDRLIGCLNGTILLKLALSANGTNIITWFVDAAFAVHPDFKSHTGGTMTMGEGKMVLMSKKQKIKHLQ